MDDIQTTCIKTQHSAAVSLQASADVVAAQAFAVATAQHSIATTTHAYDTSAAVNNFSVEDRALKINYIFATFLSTLLFPLFITPITLSILYYF